MLDENSTLAQESWKGAIIIKGVLIADDASTDCTQPARGVRFCAMRRRSQTLTTREEDLDQGDLNAEFFERRNR